MNIYEETKFIMKKYNVHANKKLGQNFLFDEQALETIANGVERRYNNRNRPRIRNFNSNIVTKS